MCHLPYVLSSCLLGGKGRSDGHRTIKPITPIMVMTDSAHKAERTHSNLLFLLFILSLLNQKSTQ